MNISQLCQKLHVAGPLLSFLMFLKKHNCIVQLLKIATLKQIMEFDYFRNVLYLQVFVVENVNRKLLLKST